MYNDGGENSDQPSSAAPELPEQPLPTVILESDRHNDVAEHLIGNTEWISSSFYLVLLSKENL